MFNQLPSSFRITDTIAESNGVYATLQELIALKRFSQSKKYQTQHLALQPGIYRSPRKGRGMDFAEVRHYQAGDEIRHMEWRITAKTGKPHIKLFEEERERPVILLVDFNASMFFGTKVAFKSCVAAQLAALIAWQANMAGDRVGGLVYSAEAHQEITPKNREAGVLSLLATLAQYNKPQKQQSTTSSPTSTNEALIRLRRVIKPGSLIVFISDFYTLTPSVTQQLARLRQHNELLAYHIVDILELNAPPSGIYPMTDGDTTLNINTFNQQLTLSYNDICNTHNQKLKKEFQKLSIPFVQVLTSTDLPLLVYQTFPRRHRG